MFAFLKSIWDQLEYSAVGDTGSVSNGKPASLVAGSTTMATFARG